MAEWSVAYNEWTTLYEVHKAGCKHLTHPKFGDGFCINTWTGESAAQIAADFEAGNEGCITKLGPCAVKKGA